MNDVVFLRNKINDRDKHMIQKVVQKLTFMNCGDNDDEDEESEEDTSTFVRAATKKTHLSSWYSKIQDRKPLLIIVEDRSSSFCLPSSCTAADVRRAVADLVGDFGIADGHNETFVSILTATDERQCYVDSDEGPGIDFAGYAFL